MRNVQGNRSRTTKALIWKHEKNVGGELDKTCLSQTAHGREVWKDLRKGPAALSQRSSNQMGCSRFNPTHELKSRVSAKMCSIWDAFGLKPFAGSSRKLRDVSSVLSRLLSANHGAGITQPAFQETTCDAVALVELLFGRELGSEVSVLRS